MRSIIVIEYALQGYKLKFNRNEGEDKDAFKIRIDSIVVDLLLLFDMRRMDEHEKKQALINGQKREETKKRKLDAPSLVSICEKWGASKKMLRRAADCVIREQEDAHLKIVDVNNVCVGLFP